MDKMATHRQQWRSLVDGLCFQLANRHTQVSIYGKWVYLFQVSSISDFWNMNNDPNALATEWHWRM